MKLNILPLPKTEKRMKQSTPRRKIKKKKNKSQKKQMLKKTEIIDVLRERMMKTKTGRINMQCSLQ